MACADCELPVNLCPESLRIKSSRAMRILLKAGRQVWLIVIDGCKAARIARRLFRGYVIGAHRTQQFYWPALPSAIRRRVIPHCRARTHGLRRFRDADSSSCSRSLPYIRKLISNRTTRCLVLQLRAPKPSPRPNCRSLTEIRPRTYRRRMPRGTLLRRSKRQLAQRVWPERLDPSSAGVIE